MNRIEQLRRRRPSPALYGLTLLVLLLAQGQSRSARAQSQWTPNGDNINNTNTGNVGVGTSAPAGKLEIKGGASDSGTAALSVKNASDANLLFVGNDGNIGIGTNTPGGVFDLQRGSSADILQRFWNTGAGGAKLRYVSGIGATSQVQFTDETEWLSSIATNNQIGMQFRVRGTGLTNNSEASLDASARMTIARDGNVGIGTTNPTRKLDLGGDVSGLSFEANGGSPNSGVIRFGDNSGWKFHFGRSRNSVGGPLNAGTSGVLMTIQDNGNVGVGTSSPGFKLDVAGNVNATGFCIGGICKTDWSQVGGPSQWKTSGSNIYYDTGNVGIATQTPGSAKLVIGGTFGAEGLDLATSDQYANLRVIRNSKSVLDRDLFLQYGAGAGSRIRFYTDNNETMTLVGGRLGIGTIAPAAALDVNGDIRVSGNINAKYQDVAEWVPSTQSLAAGTVVVLDTSRSNHVMASAFAYDTRVAGVVSAQPGVLLGERGEGKLMVATTGRVKVRVDATRGPVRVGDLLVTSEVEGLAMKSEPVAIGGRQMHLPGTLIGKALEPLEKGVGEILVLLSLQ